MMSFLIISSTLSLTLVVLFSIISWNTKNIDFQNKLSSFECGFESLSASRYPFSVRFFVLVVLFVIFDIELILLFPFLIISSLINSTGIMVHYSLFLVILIVGLLYEWYTQMLEWA